jgi:type II secretion system protein I
MGDRRGFTLLEVLVSLSILAGTLLLAYRIISGAISAADRSERWTTASYLAEALVLESVEGFPDTAETEGKFPPPMEAFTWKRSIVQAAHKDAREVHVVVRWTSEDRKEELSLTGLAVR